MARTITTFFKSLLAILLSLIVSIVLLFVAIAAITIGAAEYFAPAIKSPKQGSVLEINLSEEISDSPIKMPLINLRKMSIEQGSSLSLLSSLRALEAAAEDPNITALSLRMDGENRPSLAMAEELRDAVARFKTSSGKPVYGYSQSYSQSTYYLASIADSLYVEPLGGVEWQGIASAGYYYGDMLREVGVGVEAFRPEACSYKSAIEPYTSAAPSEESREQSQRLVDELWRGVLDQVSQARNIKTNALKQLAQNEILVESGQALKSGLIDVVGYTDEYEKAFERCGVMRNKDGNLRRVTLFDYSLLQQQALDAQQGSEALLSSKKIGVIYADGVIMDGESEGGSDPIVGSQTLCRLLSKAREDESVKAVILRVNSPGGSALAADAMWREVELLRKEKPVVVSMGSYAASGGYYISAPADMIVANRYTLTGSIGVYSIMFNYAEAMSQKLKINIDGVGSEPSADFGRTPRKLNAAEQAAMRRSVDEVYTAFTTKVSEGRNLPIGVVSTLSGGRVWSGVEAEACGLADAVGGIHKALSIAVDRSSLSKGDYQVVEISNEESGIDMLMSMIGVSISTAFNIGEAIEVATPAMRQLKRIEAAPKGLIMHAPEQIRF